MRLGQYLKKTRENLKLKLREVEERTGISNAYLSQLENKKIANPSPSILHKLADCYSVSYSHLMQLAGYPTPEGFANNNNKKFSPSFRLAGDFSKLTREEEDRLYEYLQFLRSRKQKK